MKKHLLNENPNEFTRYKLESMFVNQGDEGGEKGARTNVKRENLFIH